MLDVIIGALLRIFPAH